MNPTRAQILAAVESAPQGVTTEMLSEKFNAARYSVSSGLSKLAAYGDIIKVPGAPTGHRNAFLWRRKMAAAP